MNDLLREQAPAADGAVVTSLRGGDFELTVGQDFSVGYLDHTSTSVYRQPRSEGCRSGFSPTLLHYSLR